MGSGIKGNGEIISKEISINDYSKFSVAGSADVVYEAKPDARPYLRIEIDSNLMEYLEIKNSGNSLDIGLKPSKNINPTEYKIYTNSSSLKKIDKAGSGSVTLKNEIATDDLSISQAGSGDVIAEHLNCGKINVSSAGSGKMTLAGKADSADLELAGSGKIEAYSLDVRTASCDIAGSGKVNINALEKLEVSIAGSGSVKYKGSPEIDKSITGSGKVTRVD